MVKSIHACDKLVQPVRPFLQEMSNQFESLLVKVRVNYSFTLISFFTFFLCLPQYFTTLPGNSHNLETLICKRKRSLRLPDSGFSSPENQQFLTPTSPGQPSTSQPPGIGTLLQTKIQPLAIPRK